MTQLKVLSAWNILPAALLITAGWFLLDDNPSNTYTGSLFLILLDSEKRTGRLEVSLDPPK